MENNEKNIKAQHSTGKHPEPSENVQSDIETVTPDTENPGHEKENLHESHDKPTGESETTEGKADEAGEEQTDEPEEEQTSDKQDKGDESGESDVRGDVETISP